MGLDWQIEIDLRICLTACLPSLPFSRLFPLDLMARRAKRRHTRKSISLKKASKGSAIVEHFARLIR